MSVAALEFISKKMEEIGVPYQFGNWEGPLPEEYYCIADGYIEPPSPYKTESGKTEATLYLRLYTRKNKMVLERAKELIERTFEEIRVILDDGSAVIISYDGALPTPTVDKALNAMKIDLKIQEWRAK